MRVAAIGGPSGCVGVRDVSKSKYRWCGEEGGGVPAGRDVETRGLVFGSNLRLGALVDEGLSAIAAGILLTR